VNARFSSIPVFSEILDGRTVLKAGDTGPAVSALQEVLQDMGFAMSVLKNGNAASGVDGAFGKQTENGVRNFQVHARKQHSNISVSGVLDAPTMRALDALAPEPGKKAWASGQPNHAPIPRWNGDPTKTLRVVVAKDEHRTFLFDGSGSCVGIFPNACGASAHATDSGLKKVATKLGEDVAKSAGKQLWNAERAFGKRIIDLSWDDGTKHGEELHGTYEYHTMGTDVSHGCVRHNNEDIIKIFDSVKVGDRIAIVPSVTDPRLRV
jgi:hypothetical protein